MGRWFRSWQRRVRRDSKPGELIWIRGNRQVRVLDLVPVEQDDSPYTGWLMVRSE
jgi:hypothetical protein